MKFVEKIFSDVSKQYDYMEHGGPESTRRTWLYPQLLDFAAENATVNVVQKGMAILLSRTYSKMFVSLFCGLVSC